MRWRRSATVLLGLVTLACNDPPPVPERTPTPLDPDDHDRDGHRAEAVGGDDCDDRAAAVFPGATETCDGRDESCDGVADDGFDCAPGDERPCVGDKARVERCMYDCRWPGTCEAGPALDGDCTEVEGNCWPGQSEDCESGCQGGRRTCRAGCAWGPCEPPPEQCNGVDDDCDDEIDEGTWDVAGPIAEHEWVGTTDLFTATVADDGRVAILQTTSSPVGAGAFLTWAVHDGVMFGAPIGVTADMEGVVEIDVAPQGPRAVCAVGRTDRVDLFIVDREGVRETWSLDGDLSPVHLTSDGEEIFVVAGGALHRFDAAGTALRAAVPLAESVEQLAWSGEALVTSSMGLIRWLDRDGEEISQLAVDADRVPVLAVGDAEVAAAFVRADGTATMAVFDDDGNEVWGASARAGDGLVVDGMGWTRSGLLPSPVGPAWLVTIVSPTNERWGWQVAGPFGTGARRAMTRWHLPRALDRVLTRLVSGSSVNALVFADDGVAAAPVGCHVDECFDFPSIAEIRGAHREMLSAVIRFDDASLEPTGFAMFPGGGSGTPVTEDEARRAAAAMIEVDGALQLLGAADGPNFVFLDDGDASLDAAIVAGGGEPALSLTRRNGAAVTFGTPDPFDGVPEMAGSCGQPRGLAGDGYDLETRLPLDTAVLEETLRAADRTPIPSALADIFGVTVVRYPVDDQRHERAVVIWGGSLE